MHSLLEIIQKTTEFLSRRGVESARLNAELLVGHALGLGRMQLYLQFERPLTEAELGRLRPLVKRRGEREPLQYILGQVDFGGQLLKLDRRALIPRPETERLLELLGETLTSPPRRVLDLGTGSGALALGLARLYPEAEVTATDISRDALDLAAENVAAGGLAGRVRLVESDWFAAPVIGTGYDLIASNPPYLSGAEVEGATPEVREFEPRGALTPGPSGIESLNRIVPEAHGRLSPGGVLACETGITQHPALTELARASGYARVETRPDLTGRPRYLLAFA